MVYVGIKTCYIDKKNLSKLEKTWKIKPINVGKCWHKNLYSFKIGTFGSLKGAFKNLRKPYIKSYIDQKEVLREGDITSLLWCSDFIPSLYIFFRAKVKLLENVGIKFCISENVGKCEYKTYI